MGLAGPKENKKIGKDPRNTFWSNDTSRFGHQYLTNLGWTPGQHLGDSSSSYHTSGHITEASSTGIKIQIKDDNLGIGAKKGAQHDECTGLLGLQGLLGRLNGDVEQVEQARKEEDRRKSDWITSKWGMRFVRGEAWVADDLTKLREGVLKDRNAEIKAREDNAKPKKRKRDVDVDGGAKDKKRSSKPKSKKKGGIKREESEDDTKIPSTDRETKRSKHKPISTSTTISGDETESQARRQRKEGRKVKRELKEARRKEKAERKEKKTQKKKEKARKSSPNSDSSLGPGLESTSAAKTRSATPAIKAMNGRHAVRAKFIAAKRSAMMDTASLNEILMIKA